MAKIVILSILSIAIFKCLHCEVFTSSANMENLAFTEQYLFTSFKKFVRSEEIKLDALKKFMARVEDAHKNINMSDVGKYLGNPINTYLMLRRLSIEWLDIEKLLTDEAEESEGKQSFLCITLFDILICQFYSLFANDNHLNLGLF